MQPYPHDVVAAGRGRKPCPPHGPHWVHAVKEGSYVTKCLACGLEGPERKDGLEAKQAFDEAHARYLQAPDLIHRSS
jgi:hypothetical protein